MQVNEQIVVSWRTRVVLVSAVMDEVMDGELQGWKDLGNTGPVGRRFLGGHEICSWEGLEGGDTGAVSCTVQEPWLGKLWGSQKPLPGKVWGMREPWECIGLGGHGAVWGCVCPLWFTRQCVQVGWTRVSLAKKLLENVSKVTLVLKKIPLDLPDSPSSPRQQVSDPSTPSTAQCHTGLCWEHRRDPWSWSISHHIGGPSSSGGPWRDVTWA